MLDKKVADLINDQINKEFYSAYLYLEFSAWFEDQGLDGFANWYRVQAQEERDHAMLMFQYLQNNSVRPVLEAVAKPEPAPRRPHGGTPCRPEARAVCHRPDPHHL